MNTILEQAQHDLHYRRQLQADWKRDNEPAAPLPITAILPAAQPAATSPTPEPALSVAPAERVTLGTLDTGHHPLVATAVQAAYRWAEEKNAGNEFISLVLVAAGIPGDADRTGYGCGKTHVARAVQWSSCQALEDGTPVAPGGRFYTAKDLLERISHGDRMGDLVPAGTVTVNGIVGGTPVLVIDDVGSEGVLPYVAKEAQDHQRHALYFQVVNWCYERRISLVVTANLRLKDLAAHVGGRAWSRLQEMAPAGMMLDLTGVPDYRRQTSGRGQGS